MQNYPIHTDNELLRKLHHGDEMAFAEIYNRYWKSLYTSAHNILQVKEVAQDAVQEVFISLWKRRHEIRVDILQSYLHQAVRFQVFKAIRAEKTDQLFFNRLALISKDILFEDPLLFKELESLYQQLIQSLPPDEKEIFLLHRDSGLTYKQIAEQKNISVKTVEKKMSHALREIRFGLDDAMAVMIVAYLMQ
ncbi:RNA polymerase sigma factor [Longitalea luteola]|uniref:RNA polymerase sigma factor n=1 Tax=Longitalea luteola TaxID=2812563 RepID=UPI001A95EEEF